MYMQAKMRDGKNLSQSLFTMHWNYYTILNASKYTMPHLLKNNKGKSYSASGRTHAWARDFLDGLLRPFYGPLGSAWEIKLATCTHFFI